MKKNNVQFNFELSERINNMKEAGLFDSVLGGNSRNVVNENDDELLLERFINDTDSVLSEISLEENGIEQLEVLDALFNGGTVEDFAEAFAKLDSKKSEEYLDFVNSNLMIEDETTKSFRSITSKSTINLCYADLDSSCYSRAAYASDLEWSTICWYTGFCASTIAGFYMISYGGFWTRIAGIAAAAAGSISMGIQLSKWIACTDLVEFVSSLIGKNGEDLTAMLNSESGRKIAVISAETVGTVVACLYSPLGKSIAMKFIDLYNSFISKILSVLPGGINYTICGIPLKPITL